MDKTKEYIVTVTRSASYRITPEQFPNYPGVDTFEGVIEIDSQEDFSFLDDWACFVEVTDTDGNTVYTEEGG